MRTSNSIVGLKSLWPIATERDASLFCTPQWLECNEPADTSGLHYAVTDDARGALAVRRLEAGGFPANDPLAFLSAETPAESADRHRASVLSAAVRPHVPALAPTAAAILPGAYAPGIVAPAAPPVVSSLLDELDATAEKWGCPTRAVMHVPASARLLREMLESRGYVGVTSLAQTVLPVPGGSFDDYLVGLPRKRRTNVRRERRVFAESGMTVRRADIGEFSTEHALLHARQLRRYGHDFGTEQLVELIRRSARFFGDWAVFLVAERGQRVEAFSLSYTLGGQLHPKMSGFSEYADEHFAYFNVNYYQLIEVAQTLGLRELVFGPGTYEAKVHRGCVLDPRTTYVRVGHPVIAPMVVELAAIADRSGRAALDLIAAPDAR
ncbi:GNAT family N-acetyltransferase [Streptomyces triticiradicis]|uniref:GNAT family N-acetyltransferase n=1 Tax=Streptomyces triticiradicis TaxID=2651189 RepID=A0A7J5D5U2_9ACTN|nr:GNAT family N-acetyltransferase [Streptomyces triticiradicis]KAB1978634.1 GNAT family N-acetyltransferase [Streptomyces triticiradicis]